MQPLTSRPFYADPTAQLTSPLAGGSSDGRVSATRNFLNHGAWDEYGPYATNLGRRGLSLDPPIDLGV